MELSLIVYSGTKYDKQKPYNNNANTKPDYRKSRKTIKYQARASYSLSMVSILLKEGTWSKTMTALLCTTAILSRSIRSTALSDHDASRLSVNSALFHRSLNSQLWNFLFHCINFTRSACLFSPLSTSRTPLTIGNIDSR